MINKIIMVNVEVEVDGEEGKVVVGEVVNKQRTLNYILLIIRL